MIALPWKVSVKSVNNFSVKSTEFQYAIHWKLAMAGEMQGTEFSGKQCSSSAVSDS